MEQLIEFIGNHPFLVMAFAAVLGMLIFTETNRFTSGVKGISPYTATQMLNNGETVFVDVRNDAEYKRGHVIDSRHIPVNALDNRIHELDKVA